MGKYKAAAGLFVLLLFLAAGLFTLFPLYSHAAINQQINFQGKLTNPDGTNVTDGTYSIVFSIYSVSSGGSAIWTETQSSVTVTDGIFQVALGSVTALPGSVDFNSNSLYLGIKVGSDAEMTPRVQFTASPYAFNSSKLNGLADTSFVKLAQGIQTDSSSTNPSIAVNKTGSTASILQLQKAGSDVLNIDNSGGYTYTLSAANNPSYTITNNGAGNIINNLASTGDLIVQNNGTAYWTFNNDSTVLANLSGTSTTAFRVQDAGTDIFVIDTQNIRVYVGNPTADNVAAQLVLDSYNTSGNPTNGVDGSMYYNSADKSYRCYRGINGTAADGAWEPCGATPVDRAYEQYDEFMSGTTASGGIGTLGWTSSTIGGAPTYSYNNATPAVSSDRPGILRIRTTAVSGQGGTMQLTGTAGTGSTNLGAGQIVRFSVAVASNAAQVLRIGLHNETTAITAPTTGIYWEFDPASSANWRYCYVNAVPTATCVASGVAVAANTFVTLEIRLTSLGANTSSADFFINGTRANVTGVTVNTTNLVSPAMTCYTTAAAAKDCFIDYFQFISATSTRR